MHWLWDVIKTEFPGADLYFEDNNNKVLSESYILLQDLVNRFSTQFLLPYYSMIYPSECTI